MDTHNIAAFRAGFLNRLAELPVEKSADWKSTAAGAIPKMWSGAKSLVGKGPGSQMGMNLGETAGRAPGAPSWLAQAPKAVMDTAAKNPKTALGLGAGALVGTNAATGLGVKNVAETQGKELARRTMDTANSSVHEYINGMGGGSWMGRLMMLLNFLMGGNKALGDFRTGLQKHLAGDQRFDPRVRNFVSSYKPTPVPAAAPTTPPPAPT